jgi:hypothetical protein
LSFWQWDARLNPKRFHGLKPNGSPARLTSD